MSDEISAQFWSVEVSGQIYEASLDELIQWVGEGALLPGDKVRKGNLRWIVAGKVPQLMPHFAAKENGGFHASRVDALIESKAAAVPDVENTTFVPKSHSVNFANSDDGNNDNCRRHPDAPALVVCADCGLSFCRDCPSTYGGVKICPECGGMCKSKVEVGHAQVKQTRFAADLAEGFGVQDFACALSHPFKYKSSLFFGAVMFAFFTFGQSASALGGIFMFSAALTCMLMANMLTFGVLANTVENFSQGNVESNFMPDFDDFSMWDDVLHPFFLSIGVYISSFGLFILILLVGMYFVISSLSMKSDAMRSDIEKIPGTHYYDTQRTVQQSEQVKGVLGSVERQNEQRLKQIKDAEDGQASATEPTQDTEASVMEANDMIQQHRQAQMESVIGKDPSKSQEQTAEMVRSFLSLAAPIVVLAAIALLWGLFFFPAACAVAGYTRSFSATINPLVGLDTIKRLGIDYIKILGMCLLIGIASGIVGMLLGILFSPFSLPGFGNIPAKAMMSLFTFYFSIVFSCILGLALYKNSDRLKLLR